MLRIALINAPLKTAVCDYGVGHQVPLGLLMIGGPLLDEGHHVTLIDAARDHLTDNQIVSRLHGMDVVMIAHVGSTTSHPCCLRVLRAVKDAMPHVKTVYGGVHPTYHYQTILAEHPEVDIIVRGEGEATVLDLVRALDAQTEDLSTVHGIVWRREGSTVVNHTRVPITDLDACRIAWELIEDWDKYQAFGMGRAAVVQWSRGCPHTCTYCGQWMFWKKWRYRDTMKFVDEVEMLRREHAVRFFWIADENPTTLKEEWGGVLAEIARRKLDVGLCASIRAQDIARDADLLPIYKQAGFLYVLLGVETVTDDNFAKINKGSTVDEAYQAIRLLRENNIMSIVDYIFGIDDETPKTLWRGFRGLLRYDGDFVNALYMTPHAWTPLARTLKDAPIVQEDLHKWDYRHQILGVKNLSPTQLFIGVKLVEVFYHIHPRRLWRALAVADKKLRKQLRYGFTHTAAIFWYEIGEHILDRLRSRHRRAVPIAGMPTVSSNLSVGRASLPAE
jgi:anaerobic magnesium-protoporphyrin IX monomethyl ester cyclase